MIIMANYMLTGVDDEQWRRFKASCDLQGITIKEFFIYCIDTTVKENRQRLNYHKTIKPKPKIQGKQ